MNGLLARCRPRTKLLILLLAPLLGLTYLSAGSVIDRRADVEKSSSLLRLVDFSVRTV